MEEKENILGTEKIGKLLRKFAVPCIISLLVNSLYNIVDQVFIGWNVGYLGNGATNVVFPLVMMCLAIALTFGDGSSAFLSLKLGENKKEEAKKGVCNGILLSIIVSLVLFAVSMIFLPQILNLFGCTADLKPYALDYGYIVAMGIPFMILGITLGSIIRADGSPKYAMFTMIFGAILNVGLDYLFLFKFGMGVKGAAIATTISQAASAILNIIKIRKFNTIHIGLKDLKLSGKIARSVTLLGVSSFISEMSIVFVMIAENNLLTKYGATSEFGPNIPITVLGIVMKISQILNSIVIGIAAGSQPIIGFNYGARNFKRVKSTLKRVLVISVGISTFAFLLFQLIPDKLIAIFGNESTEYVKFACLSFRTYLMLCIVNGIQIPACIFFQAIGKSAKSAILSISRQIVFLIPGMFILGYIFGIRGVLYAGPVSDGMAFVIAGIFLIREIRILGKDKVKSTALVDDTSTDDILSNKTVITISREYGSGGRAIGWLVADKLGIKLYDKDLITAVAEKTGLSPEYIENSEQKRNMLDGLNNGYYYSLTNADELFMQESKMIKEIASKESCVIIGRCADYILKDYDNVINIFIYADMEDRMKRAIDKYGISKSNAEKEIKNKDKRRASHYKYYTGNVWGDSKNYDLCINSSKFSEEEAANLICDLAQKFGTNK